MRSFFKKVNLPEPKESEDKKQNIIKWGVDNLYPQFLNYLLYNCALHGGIIKSKVNYITSGELVYNGTDKDLFEKLLKNGNSEYDLNELIGLVANDLEIYSGFLLKIYRSPFNSKELSKIEVVDFDKHRKSIVGDTIFLCEDWSDYKATKQELKPYVIGGDERVSYLIYEERPKQYLEVGKIKIENGNYPLPSYNGGLTSILTEIKIPKYQLNEISNNFSLGTIINLNKGEPKTLEDKQEIERNFDKNASGEGNAGGIMIIYNNGKEEEATVVNISGNNLNERYLSLSKDVRDNILLSHSITTPILFGIKTEGSLGNSTELEIGYNIMNDNYFENSRKKIMRAFNYIYNSFGLQGKIEIENKGLDYLKTNVDVAEQKPIEFKSQKTKFQIESEVIELFEKFGRERQGDVLFTRNLKNGFNADEELSNCLNEFKKQAFNLSQGEKIEVLNLINKGETFDTIKKALGVNPNDLMKAYNSLKQGGYLSDEFKVTNLGRTVIAQNNESLIEIVFSYDVNTAISNEAIIPTTRDFCRRLVELSRTRIWSKDDIDNISNAMGYNVFNYRGGWYRNPDTDKNTPWCRHIWKQEITFR